MKFEEFKIEVEKGIYYDVHEIAYMASQVEDKSDLNFIANEFVSNVEEHERIFRLKLKAKGVNPSE